MNTYCDSLLGLRFGPSGGSLGWSMVCWFPHAAESWTFGWEHTGAESTRPRHSDLWDQPIHAAGPAWESRSTWQKVVSSVQMEAGTGRSARLGLCSLFSHFNSLQHHNAVFPCSPRPHVCLVMSQLGVNASLVMSPRAPRLTPSPPESEKAAAQLSQACGSQPADCNKASQHPDSAHTRWGKRSKRRYWQVLPWSD